MPFSVANNPIALHVSRETAALYGSCRAVGLLVFVTGLAGVSGPFGTHDALPLPQRLLYWSLIVFGTALAGQVCASAAEHWLHRWSWPRLATALATALVTAVPVSGVVVMVILVFGFRPDAAELSILLAQCLAVVAGIVLLTSPPTKTAAPSRPSGSPELLARLPASKRGRLLRLQARDHYVEVVTTGGQALVYMRFRDAIAETAPEQGVQVHRSHWIALHAVSGRCRTGDKSGVRLCDGTVVPVGRTFRSAIRDLVLP